MRTLILSLISSALVASCASAPPNNPWIALTTETSEAATPLDCGSFPSPSDVIRDDNDEITDMVYDKFGSNALNDYRKCSEANENIALEHSKQIDQLKIVRKTLTEMGRTQRDITDMKQEMLDSERKHNFFMRFGLYAVIVGMGLAL